MSIAVQPRDVVGGGGGGGGGGNAVVERRIGCNAAVAVAPCSVQAHDDDRGEISTSSSSLLSSSSIGKDSDGSFGEGLLGALCHQEDSGEVQSEYKGPLSAFDALEESLPIRHGISRFYSGKSKSFSNLRSSSLTASSSSTDLAKADNPYAKKRKNALAFSLTYQRTYQKPTSCGQSLLSSVTTESNGDVSESKRQRPLNEPIMTKKNGLI